MIVICHWCYSETDDRNTQCKECGRLLGVGQFLFSVSYPDRWGKSLTAEARERIWKVVELGLVSYIGDTDNDN